jgi:hypothetical protein
MLVPITDHCGSRIPCASRYADVPPRIAIHRSIRPRTWFGFMSANYEFDRPTAVIRRRVSASTANCGEQSNRARARVATSGWNHRAALCCWLSCAQDRPHGHVTSRAWPGQRGTAHFSRRQLRTFPRKRQLSNSSGWSTVEGEMAGPLRSFDSLRTGWAQGERDAKSRPV